MSDSLQLPPESPVILSFSGPDAVRFLNGQITQDASRLREDSLPSCVTDAKGRLQYFVKVFAGPSAGSLWITCPRNHSEGLRERLERYLIADDVEVEDLSEAWTCVRSSGKPDDSNPTIVRHAKGCFGDGFDCWWKSGSVPEINPIDSKQAERLRISHRIPQWGNELETGMLPPEAGLDHSSISYAKGCYIGQEVLSRIKSAGKLNRRLAAFEIDGVATKGDQLILDGNEVGHLTSVAQTDADNTGFIALGYLKKTGFDSSSFKVTDSDGTEKGIVRRVGWA